MSAPHPPADLAERRLSLVRLRPGDVMHRFYALRHEPVYFDRSAHGRLNAPDGRYGVLYAAKTPAGAFAETFMRSVGRTMLPLDLVQARGYVQLAVTSPLTFVRLAGPGLAIAGATAEVTHGGLPYDVPRAWSAAIHGLRLSSGKSRKIDGIAYRARHDDDEICYAIFERAAGGIREASRLTALDCDWFWRLAERYGAGLAPLT